MFRIIGTICWNKMKLTVPKLFANGIGNGAKLLNIILCIIPHNTIYQHDATKTQTGNRFSCHCDQHLSY